MKFLMTLLILSLVGSLIFHEIYFGISFGITLSIGLFIFIKSNELFVFREWALFLYATNYLLSPSITYQLDPNLVEYGMKIPFDEYFALALPGFLLLSFGMYVIPNKLFKPDFMKIRRSSIINEGFLLNISLIGLLLRVLPIGFPTELEFFVYLLSMIRFIGSFSLFSMNPKKYWWLVSIVLFIELLFAFKQAMYHDALMWLIFFTLLYLYTIKPKIQTKLIGLSVLAIFVLFIQAIKVSYRDQIWNSGKEASVATLAEVGNTKSNTDVLIGEDNLLATLNRGNQAWIFASTVNHMNRFGDFQGLSNVNKYIEAALLPRFLAPNKLSSNDKVIFNQFSGHTISETTSMGLGVFADGYIAYGSSGVYIFTFILGMLFSLTFKLVEGWTKISPFYVLLLLPILNYAVRPDCELQTTVNHLVKSVFVFGVLVKLTSYRFTLHSFKAE
jgi:hypothetical protein